MGFVLPIDLCLEPARACVRALQVLGLAQCDLLHAALDTRGTGRVTLEQLMQV